MSPATLIDYVDALKKSGLMSCHVRVPTAEGQLELALVFALDLPQDGGTSLQPGGWKGPERLDAHFEDELPQLIPPKSEA